MKKIILFIIAFAVLSCQGLFENPASAEERDYIVSLQFENDFFGGGTDRHFTHGTRLECLTKPIDWISDAADKIPWFSKKEAAKKWIDRLETRASISLGQSIFTPEDTAASRLILDDRPYSGWLYLGFGLVANQGKDRYDKLELEIGMVGPSSFAKEVQTFWHSMLGLYVPNGWDNQLDNEFGAVLYYEQARRLKGKGSFFGLTFDAIPHFGGSIGNVFTYAGAGITFRLGPVLTNDFGPPRIRPSLPGSGYSGKNGKLNWYLFAGIEGRGILRNIFLDGNTFTDSHSVDKKSFVGDLQGGIVIQFNRFRLSYTQIVRSREFKGQEDPDVFGSVSLSCLL